MNREQCQFRFYQFQAFFITFFAYASMRCLRTAWSYQKYEIVNDASLQISYQIIGSIDMIFLWSYSSGMYMLGWIGDKLDLRIYQGLGYGVCSISFMMVGILALNAQLSNIGLLLLQMVNGFFQSIGFPGALATMGNWFPDSSGVIYSLWGSNPIVGNITGYIIGTLAVETFNLSWHYTIIFSASYTLAMTFVVIFMLKPNPTQAGFSKLQDSEILQQNKQKNTLNDEYEEIELQESERKGKEIKRTSKSKRKHKKKRFYKPFLNAWLIPKVPYYALIYTIIKSVHYSVMFWISDYLKEINLSTHSAYIAISYEIGNLFGSFLLGYLNQKYNYKAAFMPFFLGLSGLMFLLTKYFASYNLGFYYLFQFLGGVGIGGPFTIISTAIVAQLGSQNQLDKKAISTVSGVIEGTGSFGSAFLQFFIPFIRNYTFALLGILSLVSTVLLLPVSLKEFKSKSNQNFSVQ